MRNSRDIDTLRVLIFSSTISFSLASLYLLFRFGLEELHIQYAFRAVGFSLLAINLPYLLHRLLVLKGVLFLSQSVISLFLLLFTFTVGFYLREWFNPHLSIVIVSFGYLFYAINLLSLFQSDSISRISLILFFSGVLSFWIAAVFWGYGIYSPMFFESFAIKLPHIDSLFHITISKMISTYSMPSTGLNGVYLLPYHYGSHFYFSAVASILQVDLLLFYPLVFPIYILPFLVSQFLVVIIKVTRSFFYTLKPITSSWFFWGVIIIGFVGFIDIDFLNAYKAAPYNIFISESYSVSIVITLIFVAFIIETIDNDFKYGLAFAILIPIFFFLIGVSKISTLYLVAGCFYYAIIRLKLLKNRFVLIASLLGVIIGVFTLCLTIDFNLKGSIQIDFLNYYQEFTRWRFFLFFVSNYSWFIIICLVIFFLGKKKISRMSHQSRLFRSLELLVCLVVLGCLPGLFLKISGGSAGYFIDFQNLASLVLLIIVLSVGYDYFKPTKELFKFLSVMILMIILFLSAMNMRFQMLEMQKKYLSIRVSINSGTDFLGLGKSEILKGSFPEGITRQSLESIIYQPAKALESNLNWKFFRGLVELGRLNSNSDSKPVLYIENKNGLHTDFPCSVVPFAVTATTGLAVVNGMPYDYCPAHDYGYEQHDLEDRRRIGGTYSSRELCASIEYSIANGIIVLDYKDHTFTIKDLIRCF